MDQETKDTENSGQYSRDYWGKQLKSVNKCHEEWVERGRKIVARYRDERSEDAPSKKFNILWSNVSTIKPSLFTKVPKPVVSRRFKESENPAVKLAAIVLEKALVNSLEFYDFKEVIDANVQDYLLPGRGTSKVVYIPTYGPEEDVIDENNVVKIGDDGNPEKYRPVLQEEVRAEYHYWEDFKIGQANVWSEVPWVAWCHKLSKEKVEAQFGAQKAEKLKYAETNKSGSEEKKSHDKVTTIWEIWCKTSNKVYWLAETYSDDLLDSQPTPIDFREFFSTPRPLYSLVTNGNLTPVPDYAQYQDQAEELDILTSRIDKLLDACKLKGWYAATEKENVTNLSLAGENELVPVEDWAMFGERGQGAGVIQWLPIGEVMAVLSALYEARERIKAEMYEVTGISDILRGASDPRETASAQRIKGQWGSNRISEKLRDVERFVRDLYRLKAEVIAEQFSIDSLKQLTQMDLEDHIWTEVKELLEDDALRTFLIDIESESTLEVDEVAEKAKRTEFVTAASSMIKEFGMIIKEAPALTPVVAELFMFSIKSFRVGRELEEKFEKAFKDIAKPDPNAEKRAAEAEELSQLEKEGKVAELQETQTKTEKTAAETDQIRAETGIDLSNKLEGGDNDNTQ